MQVIDMQQDSFDCNKTESKLTRITLLTEMGQFGPGVTLKSEMDQFYYAFVHNFMCTQNNSQSKSIIQKTFLPSFSSQAVVLSSRSTPFSILFSKGWSLADEG